MLNIENASKSELQDILVECCRSTKMCAKVFFPERFSAPFSALHDQIFDLIDSGAPRVAIAAPRGMGKTSIVALAKASQQMLFQLRNYVLYVSNSATNAELQTENLKMELISNMIIRKLFGDVKARAAEGLDDRFSKACWVAMGHTMILPRGAKQQVRGLLYKNARPDYIIVDDLEDTETIENEDQRRKLKQWFYADLMKCTSRVQRNWQIIYIDTLKHEDALLQNLINSSDWESVRLELCDDNLNSNVPEFVSSEEIRAEYEAHREAGELDVFYREYRNLPISTEDAVFKAEYFRGYEDTDLVSDPDFKHVENFVIMDPAKTVKLSSADSAIVVVGFDKKNNRVYLRDVINGKFHPDELLQHFFDTIMLYNCKVAAYEITGLNEFITQPVVNEMHRRGLYVDLIELNARGKKEERIASLAPYYRRGFIYHNNSIRHIIENQLITFPRSKLIDVADAFAYTVSMLEKGLRYFEPLDMEEDYEDPEIEFAELEAQDESPLDGWRFA